MRFRSQATTFCLLMALTTLTAFAAGAERDVSAGVQKPYLHRVPHTTATGEILFKYDPGKSFLPIGVWSVDASKLKELSEAGFNAFVMAGYSKTDLDDPARRKRLLESMSKNHLQLVPGYMPKTESLRVLARDPSILTYCVMDEPNRFVYSKEDPIERVFQDVLASRRRLKSVDPRKTTWINLVPRYAFTGEYLDALQLSWWYAFNEASEISSTDCYVITSDESAVADVGRSVAEQVILNQDRAPAWFIVQAFKDKRLAPHPDLILPTPRQLRVQVYTAIVHGATGIFYFKLNEETFATHPGIAPDTRTDWGTEEQRAKLAKEGFVVTPKDAARSRQLWRTAAAINAELASLKNVIMTPTQDLDYRIFVEGDAGAGLPIRTLLKKAGGSYYLFAVNVENKTYNARIEMPERIGRIRDLKAIIESKGTASTAGGSITDTFEPLAVRVYQFKAD